MRYALWNNKGGVGKSFLSFVFATEWAKKNIDSRVLIVDMCPQANVSEILLGGNGEGSKKLSHLIDKSDTIGGYFTSRIESPHTVTGGEHQYAIKVSERNDNIPSNVYLVPGDPALELQVQTINNIAVQELPEGSWRNVHSWVKDLIHGIEKSVAFKDREVLCIIDCNPSFASYTEQALLASDRLIIPCSPDGSSARAIRNVSRLVYGSEVPAIYKETGMSAKADKFKMQLPKIHMALLNRSTIYRKRAARAFQAMYNQIQEEILKFADKNKDHLSQEDTSLLFQHMPDAHTVAIVASSTGTPLHKLNAGPYNIKGISTTINAEGFNHYKERVGEIINNLE